LHPIRGRVERARLGKVSPENKAGHKDFDRQESTRLVGSGPDQATEHLFEAIERGDHPKWRVCVQIMPEADAESYSVNPFDLTKVWSHKDYPLIEVGEMELNRNPTTYFADVEQATFAPANVVPGISFSPDKMLQAPVLSYPDAHRYRLGVNYESLPVNQPKCPVNPCHSDGHRRFDTNGGASPNYEPNSFGGPKQDSSYAEPPLPIRGDAARDDHRQGNDDYKQAGDLFRLMTDAERHRLTDIIVDSMKSVPREIQLRQLEHFHKAHQSYGEGVARGLEAAAAATAD
jgi:catalase